MQDVRFLVRNKPSRRRGLAAVELALLLPILAFILVATIDFGRVAYYYVTVTNCARNGALWMSESDIAKRSPKYATVQQAAQADAPNLSPTPTVPAPVSGSDAYGNWVEVTVSYSFTTLGSYPGIPSSVDLSRTVRVRQAQANPDAP